MSPRHPAEPRSFVVRVYRRGPGALVGTVEDVRIGRSRSFECAAELWTAVGGSPSTPAPATSRAKRDPEPLP